MKSSFVKSLVLSLFAAIFMACGGGDSIPDTPLQTFKTYTKAIKQKDIATMKLLLSRETLKMHELEAQAQGISVDEVVKRETLFVESQKTVRLRNEKIDGDSATLEVENSYGSWETVPFTKEDGVWKIDKKGFAQRLMDEAEKSNQALDNMFNNNTLQPQPQ